MFYYWNLRALYILDVSNLSSISFANSFSQSVICLFILLSVFHWQSPRLLKIQLFLFHEFYFGYCV